MGLSKLMEYIRIKINISAIIDKIANVFKVYITITRLR